MVAAEDPDAYEEAMRGADRALWEEALEQELASIDANGTWEPARLPPERVALTCKLVFKRKRRA